MDNRTGIMKELTDKEVEKWCKQMDAGIELLSGPETGKHWVVVDGKGRWVPNKKESK